MDKQKLKLEYLHDVFQNIENKIKVLESRLRKAEELGADMETHKNYQDYVDLKKEWEMLVDKQTSYLQSMKEFEDYLNLPDYLKV